MFSSERRFFIPDCLNFSPAEVLLTHGRLQGVRSASAFRDTADSAFLAAAGLRALERYLTTIGVVEPFPED
ncbi:hypothetical protein B0H13DRAFT_2328181 [Mycena leptocephala]|nr:hypothetical protein B0H13DRAFT_2328181 [Mycena leptocephala]